MPFHLRPRRPDTRGAGAAALTVALLALTACAQSYPNSVFHGRSDFNRDVGWLFNLIIWLGVVVFFFVEGLLVFTLWKYRSRPGQREPEHVHGNTTLEIAWTVIPALILLWIAVPTVKTIWRTEAPAPANALQVEVIGHQWWWEFRYPQYKFVTANELYLPLGRTVNFRLTTNDVIHSFWIPALGGKRDLVHIQPERANYIWYTPDSTTEKAFNGVCVEYCGTSHANMRFRAFVVSPAEFDSWAAHMASPAAIALMPPAPPAAANAKTATKTTAPAAPQTMVMATMVPVGAQAGYAVPTSDIPVHVMPNTPMPAELAFDDALLTQGDVARGAALVGNIMVSGCAGCHTISGAQNMMGITGPNLTHIGSRATIGAGLFPNDPQHLARWIKNAPLMKPGIIMPTLGAGQMDPKTKAVGQMAKLTDAQIADIVAYLRALK